MKQSVDDEQADNSSAIPLSDKQMKRIASRNRKKELRKVNKLKKKLARHAKAIAEGRNLEEERCQQALRTLSGDGKRRREQEWLAKESQARSSFEVCIDCDFEADMCSKEINSLATQIRYCYSINKRTQHPSYVAVTSLGGVTLSNLSNVTGFSEWKSRGFYTIGKPLAEHFEGKLERLVYLTSDSDNSLEDLDDDSIYVIGGIVDRNRLKYATLHRAEKYGLRTAKLPLDDHCKSIQGTRILTVNHVFDILIKYRERKAGWTDAIESALSRKVEGTTEQS
jgi:tRNA (guanine9-N1)-methyltransferase